MHQYIHVFVNAENEEKAIYEANDSAIANDLEYSGADYWETEKAMELTEEVKSEILECMDYWKKEMIDNFKTLQDLIKDVKEEEIMECIPRFGYRIRGLDNYNLRNFPFCRIANDNYAICDYAEVLNILKMTNKTFVVYIDAHF